MSLKEEVLNFLDGIDIESELFDGEITGQRMYRDFDEDIIYGTGAYKFKLMWGATRLVIEPIVNYEWVIKIPFCNKPDYCEKEVSIYKEACRCGLDLFFAEENFVCVFYGNKIYVQERADVDVPRCIEDMQAYYLEHYNEDEFFEQHNYNDLDDYTYSLASEDEYQPIEGLIDGIFDAEDFSEKLNDFIFDNDINDIHYANIGFQDGLPLLIDYAGFGREL